MRRPYCRAVGGLPLRRNRPREPLWPAAGPAEPASSRSSGWLPGRSPCRAVLVSVAATSYLPGVSVHRVQKLHPAAGHHLLPKPAAQASSEPVLLVLRTAECAVADIGAMANLGIGIVSGAKRPVPLVIGAAGTPLHTAAVVAPWAFAPVNRCPVAMMVVVGIELAHGCRLLHR
jgi:hypothetical protein